MERKVKYDYAFKLECVELVPMNTIPVHRYRMRHYESNIRKRI
jgi:hypothetical protein